MISRKGQARIKTKGKTPKRNKQEESTLHDLSELEEFERFKEEILPKLRDAIAKGVKAQDIYKQYSSHAAARTVTIALTEADAGKALNAAKDILDRAQGKAVERKEFKHKLQDLTDQQLDALLLSEQDDDDESKDKAATTDSN